YSNHRNKLSTWAYITSNFGRIKEAGIHQNILGVMSNYIPSDDIYWNYDNVEFLYKTEIRDTLAALLTERFGVKEITIIIDFIREGVSRGSYSYLVYKILSLIDDIGEKLLQIIYLEDD